ncbi:thioester domain-containing protein [Arcanobacterium phocisimile]|uniref:Thioester domain-containing protein n=1 Tax=Arcanobacterium phocisimile TaxID=1302235 RepID=A0ABX7IGR8_9ACTO|nr:thioester domain-containing protein [Arcanobacterium phocisimile]QRV02022.1 thioester domain-containing protein [Arcanobacterium phocisimile]
MNTVIRIVALAIASLFALIPASSAYADDADQQVSNSNYRIEPQEQQLRGFSMTYRPVADSHARNGYSRQTFHTSPMLFTISGDDNDRYRAYCLEITVSINRESPTAVTDWDGFLGDNAFGIDPQVRRKVGWIVQHSYPARNLDELASDIGVAQLSVAQAITATQSAIWRLTDGVEPDFADFAARSRDKDNVEGITKLYEYLLSEQNVGLEQQNMASDISLRLPQETGVAGELIGPIDVVTQISEVQIDVPDGVMLVDASGVEIDTAHVHPGQEMYIDARNAREQGTARIVASASVARYHGSLITPLISVDEHGQSLVMVREFQNHMAVEASVNWLGMADVCRDVEGKPVRDQDTGQPVRADSAQCVPEVPSTPQPSVGPEPPSPQAVVEQISGESKTPPVPQLAKTGAEIYLLSAFAGVLLASGFFFSVLHDKERN